jgi:hypothetical protein
MARRDTGRISKGGGSVRTLQVAAGLVALLLYAWFVYYLVDHAATADRVTWERLTPIFASITTIAVGAAGAAFGSQVQKSRADGAERRANEKSMEADQGRALAAALKAEGGASGPGGLEPLGTAGASSAGEVAARHAALARELFPDPD